MPTGRRSNAQPCMGAPRLFWGSCSSEKGWMGEGAEGGAIIIICKMYNSLSAGRAAGKGKEAAIELTAVEKGGVAETRRRRRAGAWTI